MAEEEREEQTLEEALGEAYEEVEEKFGGDQDSADSEGGDDSGPDGEDDSSAEDGVAEEEGGDAKGDAEEEEDGSGRGGEERLEAEEEEAGDEEEEEEESDLAAGSLEPAEHWPDEVKEEFTELPEISQEFVMNTMKSMQGDYTRKTQAVADLVNALEPIKQECVQNGVSYGDAIRRMVGVHEKLKTDPQSAVLFIMQQYGIEASQVFGQEAGTGQVDPQSSQKIAELEREVLNNRQMFQAQNQAQINSTLEEFRKAAPHYDEVENDMVQIVNGCSASGLPTPPLQELYDRACWSNPAVREKVLAEQRGEKTKEKVKQRKKRVAKSKKAARTVKKTTAGHSKKIDQRMSLRDQLADAYDEAMP